MSAPGPPSVELELYKLAVEMVDRIAARRALANTFFLTVNTGLAALLGGQQLRWYVAVAGLAFALAWWWQLKSYSKLSWAKFQVINAIEQRLPVQLFTKEKEYLDSTMAVPGALRKRLTGPVELGTAERVVPFVFAGIYVAELIRQATG